jgi:hypothetical protein
MCSTILVFLPQQDSTLSMVKSANTTDLSRFGQIQTCEFENSQLKIKTSKQSDLRLSGKIIKCSTIYLSTSQGDSIFN